MIADKPGRLVASNLVLKSYADDPDGKSVHRLIRRIEEVGAQDALKLRMGPAGGHLTRLAPIPGAASRAGK